MPEDINKSDPDHFEPPNLNLQERRVLGVLVEKAKTTPDSYPLSLNSLTTGCNQKSNRDPLLSLDEMEVEETLLALQNKELVIRVTGSGRIERWRHNLYDVWQVGKVGLAIIAELLLRGAQSIGELRGRANRMEEIPDLHSLREHLDKLAERNMIVWLSPPKQRGARVTHGFQPRQELERIKQFQNIDSVSSLGAAESAGSTGSVSTPTAPEERLNRLERELNETQVELANLRSQMSQVQTAIADVRAHLNRAHE